MLQAAGEDDALAHRAGSMQVASTLAAAQAFQESEQVAQRAHASGWTLQRPAGQRDLPRRVHICVCERVAQARKRPAIGAEAHQHKPSSRHALEHERPGSDQQVGPLADDQLAHERHQRVVVGAQLLQGDRRLVLVARERAGVGLVGAARAKPFEQSTDRPGRG